MAKSPNFISQISSKLRTGVPHLTSDSETIVILDSQGKASHKLTVANIRPSDWGYIYERYVGLNYESRGWTVNYRGLEQQYSDQGIDLIVTKTQQIKYMQCKYTDGVRRFGKQRIETILYEASTYLSKQYKGKKLNFALVVPSENPVTPVTGFSILKFVGAAFRRHISLLLGSPLRRSLSIS